MENNSRNTRGKRPQKHKKYMWKTIAEKPEIHTTIPTEHNHTYCKSEWTVYGYTQNTTTHNHTYIRIGLDLVLDEIEQVLGRHASRHVDVVIHLVDGVKILGISLCEERIKRKGKRAEKGRVMPAAIWMWLSTLWTVQKCLASVCGKRREMGEKERESYV